jgi:hypothetical protein
MTGFDWSWGETNGVAYRDRPELMAGEVNDEGRVELELSHDPDRCDTRVARACGTNVVVVREVRERLGAYPTRPA